MLQKFMALFGDTFKLPESFDTKAGVMGVPADINGKGSFDLEIVGESNYRQSIWAALPPEISKQGDFRQYFIAKLVEENDNEHDKKAVAIKIKGIVGHLAREDAKLYRKWRTKNNIGSEATCRCVVVGKRGVPDYGIWVDHPSL